MQREKIKIALMILGLTAFFGIGSYYSNKSEIELNENAMYTVGVTESFFFKARSGTQIYFIYYVDGERYRGTSSYLWEAEVPGGRYYVKFSRKDPKNHEISLKRPVPSKVGEPPLEGWTKEGLKALDYYFDTF